MFPIDAATLITMAGNAESRFYTGPILSTAVTIEVVETQAAIGEGMHVGFGELYEKYAPAVHRFALFLCGNGMTADDITAETFFRAWTSKTEIRQATLLSYLLTVARNVYRDGCRRDRKNVQLDHAVENSSPGIEKRLELSSEMRQLTNALGTMPEFDRAALLLRYQEEMSYEQVADALGVTPATARVRVHRARQKLLEAYAKVGRRA